MSSGCLPSPGPGGGSQAGGEAGGHRIGLLLAAGRSRRMGCPKLALPWPPTAHADVPPLGADDGRSGRDGSQAQGPAAIEAAPRTIIGHVHDVLAAWCSSMIVMLGADADAVREALGRRPRLEVIGDGAAPMFDSIRRGLLAARSHHPDAELILLAPADHVGVGATDIGALLDGAAAEPDRVHFPQAGERGGHPVVIPSALVPVVLEWSGTDGLAGLWRARPDLVRRHLGASPTSCRDIDTPDAYREG